MEAGMGFIDKLKAGAGEAADLAGQAAGQAKELAEKTASRAKQEARELQLKRDLNDAYDDLGRTAFELWEAGEIRSPLLESRAGRVKSLREQLDELGEELPDRDEDAEGADEAEGDRPAADPAGAGTTAGAEADGGEGRA
jgi:hypothetical protein